MNYKTETILKKAWKQVKEIEAIWGTDKVKYIKEILYQKENEKNG